MKKIAEAVNAGMLVLLLLMTVGQILFRSVFEISASWSEELIQYSFAFIVFIGAIYITQEEAHITITMGLDAAPPLLKRIMRIVGRLIVLPFMITFAYGAFENAASYWNTSLPTVDWMTIGYMYAVLLVSGAAMSIFLVLNTVQDIRGKFTVAAASGGVQ